MFDLQDAAIDYAKGYADKSRIYFIEKYLYTFDATRGKKMPFLLFPRQRVFLETLANNRNVVSIKPRQCGITTLTSAWATAQCAYAEPDSPETILCIGNKLDLAQQLITKIREFLIQVPRWYWGEEYYSPDPKSEKNSKSIFIKDSKSELELFNKCRIVARSSGENAARGISAVSILILDEAAFIENGVAVYATAAATMASNPNSKTVMVSTPNGKDMLYYNTYRLALAKENNFIAVQFRWYQDPRYNKNLKWFKKNKKTGEIEWIYEPTLDKEGNIKYDENHWEELIKQGWTPRSPWYEEMCKSFNNDSVKIAQELDVSFVGSSDNVVDPEYIEMQEKLNSREPLEEMKDPLVEDTWFWKPPIEGHRYICSCLPEGEKVRTQRGLVNVQDIQETDKLLTKDGKFVNIVHKMMRSVKEEKIITFRPSNTCRKTTFTWNHPILSSVNTKLKRRHGEKRYWDFDFRKNHAEDVNIKDWLVVPNTYFLNELSDDEILENWDVYEESTRVDYKIKCPLLNDDFWWYCGMWLAEGWITKDKFGNLSVCTCHNISESSIIDRIVKLSSNIFNRKANIVVREKNNTIIVRISSKELSNFMCNNFGKYAKNKHISEWIKFLPKIFKINLIEGYNQGDGFIHKKQLNSGFTSISLRLLEDVQDILFSLGVIGSIKLHVKEGTIRRFPDRKNVSICSNKYELSLGLYDTKKLMELFGISNNIESKNRRIIKDIFFSEDLTKIYIRVAEREEKLYTGFVYNFWVDDESHTYTCMNITCGNCDPSRGSSDDFTAIEIIDMDGRDENDMPIIEQVAEYYGKKLGDEVGELLYNYATLYNNAYVVIDCTNGLGDVPLFTLLHKGYKNLYYDDSELKKYTVQQSSKPFKSDKVDIMPGFHMQGNRYPVLANFANMVRNNEFKIRSMRVINELNTWIFKGEAKRMDHMDGSHDDAITCLAMGLFVMIFSYKKTETIQNKDKAILSSYMMSGSITVGKKNYFDGELISPNNGLPFYNDKALNKYRTNNGLPIKGSYLWLFGTTK